MPLRSLKLPAPLHAKLRRKIRQLIAKGYLHPTEEIDTSYDLGFCMHIQVVPKKKLNSFFLGKPEGILAFIQAGSDVIAAAAFLYAGKTLKLSHVVLAHSLKPLLSALNKLEKEYEEDKKIWYTELIYFLLASSYVLVKSSDRKKFYYSISKKLKPVSAEDIREQVNKILDQRLKTR